MSLVGLLPSVSHSALSVMPSPWHHRPILTAHSPHFFHAGKTCYRRWASVLPRLLALQEAVSKQKFCEWRLYIASVTHRLNAQLAPGVMQAQMHRVPHHGHHRHLRALAPHREARWSRSNCYDNTPVWPTGPSAPLWKRHANSATHFSNAAGLAGASPKHSFLHDYTTMPNVLSEY